MSDVKSQCRELVRDALNKLIELKNLEVEKIQENDILTETPPDATRSTTASFRRTTPSWSTRARPTRS